MISDDSISSEQFTSLSPERSEGEPLQQSATSSAASIKAGDIQLLPELEREVTPAPGSQQLIPSSNGNWGQSPLLQVPLITYADVVKTTTLITTTTSTSISTLPPSGWYDAPYPPSTTTSTFVFPPYHSQPNPLPNQRQSRSLNKRRASGEGPSRTSKRTPSRTPSRGTRDRSAVNLQKAVQNNLHQLASKNI